jgi:hypothetical protein
MKPPVDAQAFAGELALQGVKLPLHVGRNIEAGVIFDADRKYVATVDVDRERSDRGAMALAKLIAEAINARGGA